MSAIPPAMPPGLARATALRAWSSLRQDGARVFWTKVASALGYRRLILLARPLAEPVPLVVPRVPAAFGILPEAEVEQYLTLRPDARPAQVARRWRDGARCYVARADGRIVSACWTATRATRSDYLGCEIGLAPGDAYLFDAYTLPAYRGHGVAQALCRHQLRDLQQSGYERALRATAPFNVIALKVHASSGFRPCGRIVRYGIGPWSLRVRRIDDPAATSARGEG